MEGNPENELTTPTQEEFYRIPNDLYRDDDVVESDLYFYYQRQHILFKSKKTKWTAADDAKVANSNIDYLYVKFQSPSQHHKFLHEKLTETLDKPGVPIKQKAQLLCKVSEPLLSTIYTSPKSAEVMEGAVNHVKDCMKYLNEKGSLGELIKLSTTSGAETAHALHVAAYSIALAKKTGHKDPSQLFAIGMGSLLHDIGKSVIDKNIVNKSGDLTDDEWQVMRTHPDLGDNLLERKRIVPLLSRRIVLEHHERPDGKGYPKGIRNIHTFSKIVTVADCFDALISSKEYGETLRPYDALRYMATRMRSDLDLALLEKFIELISE